MENISLTSNKVFLANQLLLKLQWHTKLFLNLIKMSILHIFQFFSYAFGKTTHSLQKISVAPNKEYSKNTA